MGAPSALVACHAFPVASGFLREGRGGEGRKGKERGGEGEGRREGRGGEGRGREEEERGEGREEERRVEERGGKGRVEEGKVNQFSVCNILYVMKTNKASIIGQNGVSKIW